MAWKPIALTVPQYVDTNGDPYSGAVLKAYLSGTSTSTNLATDSTGGTTATSMALNAAGYPEVSAVVVIPHINDDTYKLAIYATQAAADADSGALWSVDNIQTPLSETASTLVINDAGADIDLRIEGDGDADLLFVDASADSVGIGTSAPNTKLHVVSSSTSVITLESTDTGAASGPIVDLWRNSSTPSDGDAIGIVRFLGEDSGGNQTQFATIRGEAIDVTDATENGALVFNTRVNAANSDKMRIQSALIVGSPSGANDAVGNVWAENVYDNATLLSCYVFDAALDGVIDNAKWDARVPKPGKGAKGVHEPMRKFKTRLNGPEDPLDVDKYASHWKSKRHLTSLPNEFLFDPDNGLSTGEWVQRLVETVEIQAILIEGLNQRIKSIEAHPGPP